MDMRKLCLGLSFVAMVLLAACGSESGTEVSSELPPGFSKPSSERSSSDGGSDNSGESSASDGKDSSAFEETSSSSAQYSSSSEKVVHVDSSTVVTGTMTDERDGQTYKTVKIGNQTWMAENLNYAYIGVPYNYDDFTFDSTSWCYNNDPANCETYGRLYTWAAALGKTEEECGRRQDCGQPSGNIRGVCPQGWHLPSRAEWMTLAVAVDESITEFSNNTNAAGKALKSRTGWDAHSGFTNDDAYSFAALPAGAYYYGEYSFKGAIAHIWSSTQDDVDYAYNMSLVYSGDRVGLFNDRKPYGFSVRCLKD